MSITIVMTRLPRMNLNSCISLSRNYFSACYPTATNHDLLHAGMAATTRRRMHSNGRKSDDTSLQCANTSSNDRHHPCVLRANARSTSKYQTPATAVTTQHALKRGIFLKSFKSSNGATEPNVSLSKSIDIDFDLMMLKLRCKEFNLEEFLQGSEQAFYYYFQKKQEEACKNVFENEGFDDDDVKYIVEEVELKSCCIDDIEYCCAADEPKSVQIIVNYQFVANFCVLSKTNQVIHSTKVRPYTALICFESYLVDVLWKIRSVLVTKHN